MTGYWNEPIPEGYQVEDVHVLTELVVVHIDARRWRRHMLNGGRTGRAAVRLALYRLRCRMRTSGAIPCDDTIIGIDRTAQNLIENAADVFAEVRTIRVPPELAFEGQLQVPATTSIISFLVPVP